MAELKLVGVVGSLRGGSANGATARAAASIIEVSGQKGPDEGRSLSLFDVSEVPFYNGDVEAVALPAAVEQLNAVVASSQGLILFSPEYNGSFPAVSKNVIDWLSRPPKAWQAKAITMISTTPGPRAGLGVREHFSSIMAHQPVRLFDTFGIGGYGDKLDDTRELTDPATLSELAQFLEGFAAFCSQDAL
ncbi:MAG: NADPH-dependent FMN reductase [Acidimicrobiales bacterium]